MQRWGEGVNPVRGQPEKKSPLSPLRWGNQSRRCTCTSDQSLCSFHHLQFLFFLLRLLFYCRFCAFRMQQVLLAAVLSAPPPLMQLSCCITASWKEKQELMLIKRKKGQWTAECTFGAEIRCALLLLMHWYVCIVSLWTFDSDNNQSGSVCRVRIDPLISTKSCQVKYLLCIKR